MKYLNVLCVTLASVLCLTNAYHDRPWKCSCQCDFFPDPVGDQNNPGYSCKDILQNNENARDKDGIYWITLFDRSKAFPVYCNMVGGGWTMVFKAVSGANQVVYEVYKSAETYAENETAALNFTNQYPNHYKNRIVLNWCKFGASEARVVLYKGVHPVKELTFDAKESDSTNWFQFDKLTENPWTDMDSQPRNLFTIETDHQRSFIINSRYPGCANDVGWMMITGGYCLWEQHFGQGAILYSKLVGLANWNHFDNVGEADTKVVFLR